MEIAPQAHNSPAQNQKTNFLLIKLSLCQNCLSYDSSTTQNASCISPPRIRNEQLYINGSGNLFQLISLRLVFVMFAFYFSTFFFVCGAFEHLTVEKAQYCSLQFQASSFMRKLIWIKESGHVLSSSARLNVFETVALHNIASNKIFIQNSYDLPQQTCNVVFICVSQIFSGWRGCWRFWRDTAILKVNNRFNLRIIFAGARETRWPNSFFLWRS